MGVMSDNYNPNPYAENTNFDCFLKGEDTVVLDLLYPNVNKIKYLEFDQESVRASDGIRISYDYTRDGYKIEQRSDRENWSGWIEVAFIQSWGSFPEKSPVGRVEE